MSTSTYDKIMAVIVGNIFVVSLFEIIYSYSVFAV